MRIIQKQDNIKTTIIVLIGTLLLIGAYFGYAYATKSIWPFKETSQESSSPSDSINYSPPTDQEIESSQDAKKNNSHQEGESSEKNDGEKRDVSVGVAFAGYDPDEKAIDIRAFSPDVIEGDGTCTATLTKEGSSAVVKSSKAFIDYSSSQCEPILLPQSQFPTGGTWSLVVSYESKNSTGTSPAMNVEVEK